MKQKKANLSIKVGLTLTTAIIFSACTISGDSTGDSQNIVDPGSANNTKPKITLNGSSNIQITTGDSFADPGATAYDDQDGDLTDYIDTKSEVTTTAAGHYNVTYSVTDSSNNTVTVSRTVTVVDESENYYVDWIDNFSLPEQDSNGWSILTPSKDSQIMYVSADGNDKSAETYAPDDALIGDDVFNPVGAIQPYATIEAALSKMRSGSPDYVLLKRGDTWEEPTVKITTYGHSADERAVFGAYGDLTDDRPLIKNSGINLNESGYLAILGIHFQDSKRNPASGDFAGFTDETSKGIDATLYNTYGGFLIEDCWFEWYSNNVIQSYSTDASGNFLPIEDIIIRRNIFNNNYATTSHAQGLYSAYTSILLEENIFDHNGWYQQGDGSAQEEGKATIFNHNTYFPESQDTIFRNNIFLRPSSIGNKFTSNSEDPEGTNSIKAWNILVDNNFYAEGEVGISLGGNKDQDDGPRWKNMLIVNNVLTAIGRTFPTDRDLGWGIGISDWENGLVQGNLTFNWGKDDGKDGDYTNVHAVKSSGHVTNTIIDHNIAYGLVSSFGIVQLSDDGTDKFVAHASNHITFTHNEIALLQDSGGYLMEYDIQPDEQNFAENYYYFNSTDDYWFRASENYTWSEISNYRSVDFASYQSIANDNTSTNTKQNYLDPDRTIADFLINQEYVSSADTDTEIEILVNLLKTQRKGNWDNQLTADAINKYFRQGFSY
ncbi:DUF5011 domain-containing protein [Gynuella sunshinyii]|uniref:Pesticidal crystal protein Cry22Aa Ig-like domain-containing protein n=1 Tax=Gynuella sunshinyii YC6258 TaxID=1445510 RepID=A0A0C5VD84_9GAMM|nr:DUF5011 domain-containing protein [Gynuella sunshinyii]AJQ92502.1 hypothetical Protein YC6258_00452 [Gynuella sunshinyii YC6258]